MVVFPFPAPTGTGLGVAVRLGGPFVAGAGALDVVVAVLEQPLTRTIGVRASNTPATGTRIEGPSIRITKEWLDGFAAQINENVAMIRSSPCSIPQSVQSMSDSEIFRSCRMNHSTQACLSLDPVGQ
jgi:hypothetical protein